MTALVQRRDYLVGQRRTIIARALVGSLAGALPIPFLDDWAVGKLVGGGYRKIAAAHHVDLTDEAVDHLVFGPSKPPPLVQMAVGGVLVILGAITNILGRLRLGKNWANQATLYEEQTLVTGGIYGIVRHPLYASLIWIFFGAGLIYESAAAIIANACIFLPAMYYRAGLEEKLLEERFAEYALYRKRVGTFFPKLIGGRRERV